MRSKNIASRKGYGSRNRSSRIIDIFTDFLPLKINYLFFIMNVHKSRFHNLEKRRIIYITKVYYYVPPTIAQSSQSMFLFLAVLWLKKDQANVVKLLIETDSRYF